MIKKVELQSGFSCLNKALDNEPLFVLMGRDVAAPSAIRQWVQQRIKLGKNDASDAQIQDALCMADEMEMWQSVKRTMPMVNPQDLVDVAYTENPNGGGIDFTKPHLPVLEVGRISRVCQCGAVFGAEIHGRALREAKFEPPEARQCPNCRGPIEESRPNSRLCRDCDLKQKQRKDQP